MFSTVARRLNLGMLCGAMLLAGLLLGGCGPGGGGENCQGEACGKEVCTQGSCERGVCNTESGECESAASCTQETQQQDCVSGEKCVDGTCKTRESFCETISCERGVCSFEAGGCADADNCQGEDAKCLEGKFCNEMNQCRTNVCIEADVTCEQGVCQPSSGNCENASPCDSNAECLPDHLCVEGACRLESSACGDADGDGGCAGNKTCAYEEDSLKAYCEEPETCETSLDCNDARQCSGRECMEPTGCPADRFESNDSPEKATSFVDHAEANALDAWVCQSDTDVYEIDTERLVEATERGKLMIALDIPERERGLGQIEMTVTGPDGEEKGTATTGAHGRKDHIEVVTDIGVPDHGVFTVEVTAGEDVKSPGVDYELSSNFYLEQTIQACQEPEPLEIGEAKTGSTEDGTSQQLGSSCTTARNPSNEKIYALDLQATRAVTVQVTPQTDQSDLTMSFRSRCLQAASERSCIDNAGQGEVETFETVLEEGTHYLVIQAPDDPYASGGGFEVVVQAESRTCAPGMAYCTEGGTSEFCNRQGEAYRQVSCQAGCDPSTGRCWPPAGNLCGDAPTVTPGEGGTKTVDFRQLTDIYEMDGEESCIDEAAVMTDGPDKAFEIELPADKAVIAEATFPDETRGTMYLVDECANPGETCRVGASAGSGEKSNKRLVRSNMSDSDESYHLIVDSPTEQPRKKAEVDITYTDVICSPEATRCEGGEVVKCGKHGIAWEPYLACDLGCQSATCQGDSCATAIEIPADGQTYTHTIPFNRLTNNYDIDGAACMSQAEYDTHDSPGAEAVFETTVAKNDVIDVSWDANDPSLYVARDCSALKDTCQKGIEATKGAKVGFEYQAEQAGTYYIMADVDEYTEGSGTDYRESTFTAQVRTPSCTPHAGLGCTSGNQLNYCDDQGFSKTYSCSSSCSSGACAPPDGQICADPIPLSGGESDTRSFSGRRAIPVSTGSYGNCTFDTSNRPESADRLYEISLSASETLSVDWKSGVNKPATAGGVMYLLGSCGDLSSCKANGGTYAASGETDALTYTADSSETVYLVVARSSDYLAHRYDYQVDVNVD